MAKPDLSQLTAQELDDLISEAAKRRAILKPAVGKEPPTTSEYIVDPGWRAFLKNDHTCFLLRHPGLGWLGFIFPPHERAAIATLFLHHALLKPENQASGAAPTTVNAGGGKLH